ncbi:MAG: winged helix-turn-helix domain-containing protein [Anaerolineae bacterium]
MSFRPAGEIFCASPRYDPAAVAFAPIVAAWQEVAGLIQAGPFVIDQQRHQVWANGEPMPLTTSQFSILVSLCQNAGNVVHGDELETAVWGDVLLNDPDRLKTLIKRLRRAIAPFDNWIVSERGVGYALRPPAED